MPSSARKRGRPPAGPRGEKVSDYPQLTIRLPLATRARLSTLSLLLAQPMWRIIDDAIEAYVRHLPPDDQKILGPLVERLAKGDWPVTSHWAVGWAKPAKEAKKSSRSARSAVKNSR